MGTRCANNAKSIGHGPQPLIRLASLLFRQQKALHHREITGDAADEGFVIGDWLWCKRHGAIGYAGMLNVFRAIALSASRRHCARSSPSCALWARLADVVLLRAHFGLHAARQGPRQSTSMVPAARAVISRRKQRQCPEPIGSRAEHPPRHEHAVLPKSEPLIGVLEAFAIRWPAQSCDVFLERVERSL